MKILSISDKEGSAIDRLAVMNVGRLPHLTIAHIAIHPKRPEPDRVEAFRRLLDGADIVDCQYYKSAVTLRKLVPEMEKKKLVLTHHNEHGLGVEEEWRNYRWDVHVVKNKWQQRTLAQTGIQAILIRHAVEMEHLPFMKELTTDKIVGYVGQIKKVKGIRELKRACDELGYRLMICGKVSEAGYWDELDKKDLIMAQDIPVEKMGELYAKMRVYCANSDDGTESGTMPILEAMAAGIPVVTRKIGLVRDCGENGKNMIVRDGKYTDVEDLKASLKLVMENDDVANELRENAWRTVRQYHADVQAREYEKLWRRTLYPDTPSVSIIMPTCGRPAALCENLEAIGGQTHKNLEVVVVDDSHPKGEERGKNERIVEEARKLHDLDIRYIRSGQVLFAEDGTIKDYGLARARNLGLIEAVGDIVVICDDRLKMHPEAVDKFVRKLRSIDTKKAWVWGAKSGVFKSFVENFSATWRRTILDGGGFNERIDQYGGTTQEISGRFGAQGLRFEFCPEAAAEPIIGTHSKSSHRAEIVRMKLRLYRMGFQ